MNHLSTTSSLRSGSIKLILKSTWSNDLFLLLCVLYCSCHQIILKILNVDFEGRECEAFPKSRAWPSEDRSSCPGSPSRPWGLDFAGNELMSFCSGGESKRWWFQVCWEDNFKRKWGPDPQWKRETTTINKCGSTKFNRGWGNDHKQPKPTRNLNPGDQLPTSQGDNLALLPQQQQDLPQQQQDAAGKMEIGPRSRSEQNWTGAWKSTTWQ